MGTGDNKEQDRSVGHVERVEVMVQVQTNLCSSLQGPPAPHRRSPGSPPPAPGALPAQGEVEGVAGEEGHSQGLSAGFQVCQNNKEQSFRQKSTF